MVVARLGGSLSHLAAALITAAICTMDAAGMAQGSGGPRRFPVPLPPWQHRPTVRRDGRVGALAPIPIGGSGGTIERAVSGSGQGARPHPSCGRDLWTSTLCFSPRTTGRRARCRARRRGCTHPPRATAAAPRRVVTRYDAGRQLRRVVADGARRRSPGASRVGVPPAARARRRPAAHGHRGRCRDGHRGRGGTGAHRDVG